MRFTFSIIVLALIASPAEPSSLPFEDLVAVSQTGADPAVLRPALDVMLSTPLLDNSAADAGVLPHRPLSGYLGPVLRVFLWNIHRGIRLDQIQLALANPEEYRNRYLPNLATPEDRAWAEYQLMAAASSDVIVLTESDWGLPRTGYRKVAAELAETLRMNYVFAPEFLYVDPTQTIGADPKAYQGLHGSAVLSRYRIRSAEIRRLPDCYDWFGTESKETSAIEWGRRWLVGLTFQEPVQQEIRLGGRIMLRVELEVPDAPKGRVTVVATHLESRTTPGCRLQQMSALLENIQDIGNTVILAGDFNTSNVDSTPMTWQRVGSERLKDPGFWAGWSISLLTPIKFPQMWLFNFVWWRNRHDPTLRNIPYLVPNPESAIFRALENFRFTDGSAFDFRGSPRRTLTGTNGTLANSNERGIKGFQPTYRATRPVKFVAKYKLDWILVRPAITDPHAPGQTYRLAPHFPMTMRELNESLPGRMSDHDPISVDLPFQEPPRLASPQTAIAD